MIDNAIKYCGPGTSITIQLEAGPEGVLCSVQDTGPGIEARDLPRVTERLYRARRDVHGSGIGLALVSEILRRHGATLLIESATDGPQRGTTLRWTLPYAGRPNV